MWNLKNRGYKRISLQNRRKDVDVENKLTVDNRGAVSGEAGIDVHMCVCVRTCVRVCVRACVCVWIAQSCPTLCNPMVCGPPGSSVHGIFQVRILQGVAISSSRGSSWPREWISFSCIASRFFAIWVIRKTHICTIRYKIVNKNLLYSTRNSTQYL